MWQRHPIFQRAFRSLVHKSDNATFRNSYLTAHAWSFQILSNTLWRFSKFWRKSQYKTSNCKCFTHFQSFPLEWESRIRNISHTDPIGIHCFGGLLDKHKARKFTVQILLILNSSPPHFSEADLAILSCTPGRQEAYGLLVFRLKDSHPIK